MKYDETDNTCNVSLTLYVSVAVLGIVITKSKTATDMQKTKVIIQHSYGLEIYIHVVVGLNCADCVARKNAGVLLVLVDSFSTEKKHIFSRPDFEI